jgi:hypothetical protein
VFGDAKLADVGRVGGGDFGGGVGDAVHAPGHVGLAGAEPDVAGDDVRELEAVFALDLQGAACPCRQGRERDGPVAGGIGGGAAGLAGVGDGDGFAGCGGAPDGEGRVALEDGVRTEERRGRDGGGERGGAAEQRKQREDWPDHGAALFSTSRSGEAPMSACATPAGGAGSSSSVRTAGER